MTTGAVLIVGGGTRLDRGLVASIGVDLQPFLAEWRQVRRIDGLRGYIAVSEYAAGHHGKQDPSQWPL